MTARTPIEKHKGLLIGAVLALVAVWLLGRAAMLWADYLWFDALGFAGVFTTELATKAILAAAVFVVTAAWLAGHVLLATRLTPGFHFQIKGL